MHDLFATNAKSLSKYTSDINLFFEGLYKLFADSTYSQFAAKHLKCKLMKKIKRMSTSKNPMKETIEILKTSKNTKKIGKKHKKLAHPNVLGKKRKKFRILFVKT